MIIEKVLNNNVAIASQGGKEIVVMGRGITFQKKKGDELDDELVTKVFTQENTDLSNKLVQLVQEIPEDYFQLSDQIIRYAENELGLVLSDNIYLALTDHIQFAVENYRKGLKMKNSMLWEIKRLYRKEFQIGLKALDMIETSIGCRLMDDEAASIALHLINGQIDKGIPEIINMMNVVQEILDIVKYTLSIDYDEDSLNYYRFVTHLKFLAKRVFSNEYYKDNDYELLEMVSRRYEKAYECSQKIALFIHNKYYTDISKDELIYLTIHVNRIMSKQE